MAALSGGGKGHPFSPTKSGDGASTNEGSESDSLRKSSSDQSDPGFFPSTSPGMVGFRNSGANAKGMTPKAGGGFFMGGMVPSEQYEVLKGKFACLNIQIEQQKDEAQKLEKEIKTREDQM